MHSFTEELANGIGIILGFIAFVMVTINEFQRGKAKTKLAEFDDYIDRLELLIDEPAAPAALPESAPVDDVDRLLDILDAGAKDALRANKQNYISLRQELTAAEHARDRRNRIAIVLIGLASLLQFYALFLPK